MAKQENWKFGQGDLAMLGTHRVKIIECIQDDNNEYWYKIEALDLKPPLHLLSDEVPQSALKSL